MSEFAKFPKGFGIGTNMNTTPYHKITMPEWAFEYRKMAEPTEEQKNIQSQIARISEQQVKQIDDRCRALLIEHGYEKQLEKALHGKTKQMRTRNRNILRGLIKVEAFPPSNIEQISDTSFQYCSGYNIIWVGKDAKT